MNNGLNKKIGSIIKEKRKENNYSLDDIQLMLKNDYNIDLDASNISRYENGTVKNMNPKFLRALCKVNGIDYVSIFQQLGYLDNEVDPRIKKLNKREKDQYKDFMNDSVLYFQDEGVSFEDKEKFFNSLQDAFFEIKLANKRKK